MLVSTSDTCHSSPFWECDALRIFSSKSTLLKKKKEKTRKKKVSNSTDSRSNIPRPPSSKSTLLKKKRKGKKKGSKSTGSRSNVPRPPSSKSTLLKKKEKTRKKKVFSFKYPSRASPDHFSTFPPHPHPQHLQRVPISVVPVID